MPLKTYIRKPKNKTIKEELEHAPVEGVENLVDTVFHVEDIGASGVV